MPVTSRPVALLTPEAYARGGVQTYSRRVAEILSAWAKRAEAPFHCVSLLDKNPTLGLHANPVTYASFSGASGNRATFVKRAAAATLGSRPAATVVMHLNLAPAALLLRAAGIGGPYAVVLHGIEAWRRVNPVQRAAARAARCIVTTTRYTAEVFGRENGVPAGRFRVIPLAVGESGVDPLPADPVPGMLRVMAAGRLASSDSYKGFDCLLDAVRGARASGADVRLVIAGRGDDMPRLEERAASLDLNGAVRFAGEIPDRDFQLELRRCDVFALPSRSEGFGLVYIEAMRAGRPCIAGNHAGPREVVTDGQEGYLVEHGDAAQLASRLVALCHDPELRRRMARQALATVKSRYLFPRMRDAWFALLDDLTGRAAVRVERQPAAEAIPCAE